MSYTPRRSLFGLPDFAWQPDIPCQNHDPDLFFPEGHTKTAQAKEAKAVCRPCPHRAECLDFAVRTLQWGIWAGTDDREREHIRQHASQPGRAWRPETRVAA